MLIFQTGYSNNFVNRAATTIAAAARATARTSALPVSATTESTAAADDGLAEQLVRRVARVAARVGAARDVRDLLRPSEATRSHCHIMRVRKMRRMTIRLCVKFPFVGTFSVKNA